MKKLLLIMLAVVLSGCSQVQMSPPYRAALESSAINVAELSGRCQAGDDTACKQGLMQASETLNLLVDGLHGNGGD